jgi:uncharacterized protein YbjQ (UPF0145 family)
MLLSATPNIERKVISDYRGVVAGAAIPGANIFSDMFASIRDVVGGRSGAREKEVARACVIAFREMGQHAKVGVDIDYEVVGRDGSMMMVSAAAVILD